MKKIGLLVIVAGAALLVSIAARETSQPNTESQKEGQRTFKSAILKFEIKYPEKFSVNDQQMRVVLRSQLGEIIVARVGTQFDSLEQYLSDLSKRHQTNVISSEDTEISGYPSKKRVTSNPDIGDSKSYEIFVSPAVYSLSTTSVSLYPDLDKIAQSFRYLGP